MNSQLNNNRILDERLARERGFWDEQGKPDYRLADEEMDFVMECYPDIGESKTCEVQLLINRTELKSLCVGSTSISNKEFSNYLFKVINHGVGILLKDAQIRDLRNDFSLLRCGIKRYGKKRTASELNELNKGIQLSWPSKPLVGCTIKISPQAQHHLGELSGLLGIPPAEICITAIWFSLMTRLHNEIPAVMAHDVTAFLCHIKRRQRTIHLDVDNAYPGLRMELSEEGLRHAIEELNKKLAEKSKKRKKS